MKKKLLTIVGTLVVIAAGVGGALYYAYPVKVSLFAGLTRNYILSLFAPPGTTTTELNAAYKGFWRLRHRLLPRRHWGAPRPETGRATTERSLRSATRH
jgi:hypothetical protein